MQNLLTEKLGNPGMVSKYMNVHKEKERSIHKFSQVLNQGQVIFRCYYC